MRHRQIATAIFLFSLLFESTIILAKVIKAMRKEPKTIEPKADVKSQRYAVSKQFLPSTLQYQKEQATAMVNTIKQQNRKPKKSQMKNHRTTNTLSAVLLSPLFDLSSATAKIQLREQIQKIENNTLSTTLMIGLMKTAHFQLRNCDATLINMIPISIFFLRHINTRAYTTNVTRKGMASPSSPIINPKIPMPKRRLIESTIRQQTIALGMILINRIQMKLMTIEMAKHAAISPARSETQRLLMSTLLPFS